MRLRDAWWLLLLRGLFLIIFGFIAIGWPGITFEAIAYIFALYILLSGVLNIIYGITGMRRREYWFLSLALGVLEVGVGAYALQNPLLSESALVALVSFTFIIRGVLEIVAAFDDAYTGRTRTLLIVSGILGLIAGLITLKYPVSGSYTFTWIIGIYALIGGSLIVALSIFVKELVHNKIHTKVEKIRKKKSTRKK